MEWDKHNFLSFWDIFCPFPPLMTRKIKIWKKKTWRCYPFTHVYHKWRYHLMYGSSDMKRNRQIFLSFDSILSFWALFCPLTLLKTQKSKFKTKNEKKASRYYHFTLAYHKWWSYNVWFLRYGSWQTEKCLSFSTIFCPFTLKTQKIKILQKGKKHLEISSFYTSVP